jgi:hypothetical protein
MVVALPLDRWLRHGTEMRWPKSKSLGPMKGPRLFVRTPRMVSPARVWRHGY